MNLDKLQLTQLCNLLMMSEAYNEELKNYADNEARKHGFNDWIEYYHG